MEVTTVGKPQNKPVTKRQPCFIGSKVEHNGISLVVKRDCRRENGIPGIEVTVSSPEPGCVYKVLSPFMADRCLPAIAMKLNANHPVKNFYGLTFHLDSVEVESMQLRSSFGTQRVLAKASVESPGCLTLFLGRDKLNVTFYS